ncbi:MAG: hypothetical protein ABIO55_06450 [Ginsengibacter sp.]
MKTLFVLLILPAIIFSCNSNNSKNVTTEKENYELTKKNLKQKETNHPEVFITVTGGNKHNLIGQTVVKGNIANKASVAVYKDVNIQLDFYSKTGALLETDNEIVYETLQPGQAKNFKTKYFAPKGSDSVALKVLGANVAE